MLIKCLYGFTTLLVLVYNVYLQVMMPAGRPMPPHCIVLLMNNLAAGQGQPNLLRYTPLTDATKPTVGARPCFFGPPLVLFSVPAIFTRFGEFIKTILYSIRI